LLRSVGVPIGQVTPWFRVGSGLCDCIDCRDRYNPHASRELNKLSGGHLKEIVDAHRYLESNQQIGKVVVTV
jgi:hypothetical protein